MADNDKTGIGRLRRVAQKIRSRGGAVMNSEIMDLFGSNLLELADQIESEAVAKCPQPARVILNNPATIVFFDDGTKTVVKKQNCDEWDPEKGVAMAICKRLYGNTGRYNDVIKRALEGGEDGR